MMPKDFPIIAGLEPYEERTWRVVTDATGLRRIVSHWSTPQLYDRVIADYQDDRSRQGLSMRTANDEHGIRAFWGTTERIMRANASTSDNIYVHKDQVGGRTIVDVSLWLR